MQAKTPSPVTREADASGQPQYIGFEYARLEDLVPNGDDARTMHDADADKQLEMSIAAVGVLNPLVVTSKPSADGVAEPVPPFTIREGHRRYRVAKKLGLGFLPCVVYLESARSDGIGLVLNTQREGLTLIDKADAIGKLIAGGHSAAAVKAMLGIVDDKELNRALKIATLADGIKAKLRKKEIPLDVGLALTALPRDRQEKALKAAGGKNASAWAIRRTIEEKGIPVEYALFAHDAYKGDVFEDLFARDDDDDANLSGKRFVDREQFMRLQKKAVELLMKEQRDAGELVYSHTVGSSNERLIIGRHHDKRVKPAMIFEFNELTGEVGVHKNAQLEDWQGRVMNPETGELLGSSREEKEKQARAKEREKVKALPVEDKAPFTKTGADGLKRQAALMAAVEVAADPHLAMAIATAALTEGAVDAGSITTINAGNSWVFNTLQQLDKKSEEYKTYTRKAETIEDKAHLKQKRLKDLIALKPADLCKLFANAVAGTIDVDHYGGPMGEAHEDVLAYLKTNEGALILYDDQFRGAISKAGCIAWMKLLGMDTKAAETLNRTQLLSGIEKKFGSLAAAGQKALPPLSGVPVLE